MTTGSNQTPVASGPEWDDIFQAIRQPVMILDTSHKILNVNRAACELLGKSESEVLGAQCHEVFHHTSSPPNGCPLQKLLQSGVMETNDMEVQALDGTYLITCTPILDDNQNITQIIHIATDITERKVMQKSLAETAEAASLYLDLLSHDIRNQLQGIIIGTEILETECSDFASEITEQLEGIVYRAQSLITKVQATRQLPNSDVRDIDLIQILEDVKQRISIQYTDTELTITITTNSAIAKGNHFMFDVIWIIIENAVTYNDSTMKKVMITLDESEDGYAITIDDNGRGIDDSRKLTIFNPERRYGGVGLHQVYRIMRKFQGRVAVSNRVHGDHTQGTRVTLWLSRFNQSTDCV